MVKGKTEKKEKGTPEKKKAKETEGAEEAPAIINGELCPFCHNKTLTLAEAETDIPFFGKAYIFSMNCTSYNYHKADVRLRSRKSPASTLLKYHQKKT